MGFSARNFSKIFDIWFVASANITLKTVWYISCYISQIDIYYAIYHLTGVTMQKRQTTTSKKGLSKSKQKRVGIKAKKVSTAFVRSSSGRIETVPKKGYELKSAQAKVFFSGRSQAVRIPKEFRFEGEVVDIRRNDKTGEIILSEKPQNWDEFIKLRDSVDIPDDFLTDLRDKREQKRELF